jgi:hypothetical protein
LRGIDRAKVLMEKDFKLREAAFQKASKRV